MRIIAVVNQKGGVGKTTTSVNLGAGLALRGRRVLLVDMDPQGNLTDHLLPDPAPGTERASVYDVLVEGRPVVQAVTPTSTPGLAIVPSHEDMAGCELDLASVIGREVLLRDALADLPPDAWDFVFLDCPPSLGLLSLNALAAANEVFIALQTEFFAMRGLSALDRTIDLVRRRINPQLVLGGIVPTLVDPTRLSREIMDEVRGHYGNRVFETRIRTNIRLAEAPSYGKHIFEYAPDCAGAADYAALAAEVDAGARAVPESVETPVAAARAPVAAPPSVPVAPVAPVPVAPKPAPRRGIAAAIAQAAAAVAKRGGPQNALGTQGPADDAAPAATAPSVEGGEPPTGAPAAAAPAAAVAEASRPAALPTAVATLDDPATVEAFAGDVEAVGDAPSDPATVEIAPGLASERATGVRLATGVQLAAGVPSVVAAEVVEQALAAGAADAPVVAPPPASVPVAAAPAARRPIPPLPVLKAGRPLSLARMPLRPRGSVGRSGERPAS